MLPFLYGGRWRRRGRCWPRRVLRVPTLFLLVSMGGAEQVEGKTGAPQHSDAPQGPPAAAEPGAVAGQESRVQAGKTLVHRLRLGLLERRSGLRCANIASFMLHSFQRRRRGFGIYSACVVGAAVIKTNRSMDARASHRRGRVCCGGSRSWPARIRLDDWRWWRWWRWSWRFLSSGHISLSVG